MFNFLNTSPSFTDIPTSYYDFGSTSGAHIINGADVTTFVKHPSTGYKFGIILVDNGQCTALSTESGTSFDISGHDYIMINTSAQTGGNTKGYFVRS